MAKITHLIFLSSIAFFFSEPTFGFDDLFCGETPFPELCNSIGSKFLTNKSDIKFLEFTIDSTIGRAREALAHFSAMGQNISDPQAKSAWTDCLELYDDTLNQLNQSLNPTNPTDIQTWLSVAITNHHTCENGLKDLNLASHLQNYPYVFQNLSELLVNLLAINKALVSRSSNRTSRKLNHLVERAELQNHLVVAQDGSGNFTKISDAIEAVEKQRTRKDRFVIYVKSGIYRENVRIKRSTTNLTLIGDGIDATIITSNKTVQDGYTTHQTATFEVSGNGFIAVGITFENTAGPEKKQAVALLSAADHSVFYRCSFKGYQDTLYIFSNRQFYRNCDIYGSVDFIFGDGIAVIQNCNIYVRRPLTGQRNTITAQGREAPSDITGFVIQNSRVTAAPDLIPVQGYFRTFLGRPWKPYSRVVYINCYLDSLIDPKGWIPWQGHFDQDTVYYAEYKNSGTGGNTKARVTWPGYRILTSEEEARQFSIKSFLGGDSWIDQIGLPYSSDI